MRILIVKTSSLGDIIQAFPVLHYLKQSNPQAEIDWVVEEPFAELLWAHPFVHRILLIQTKKWRSQLWRKGTWQAMAIFRQELRATYYDCVLDLQGNIKSGIVTALARSKLKVGFDRTTVPEWPNLLATNRKYDPPPSRNIREDYLFLAQKAINAEEQEFIPIKGIQLNLSSRDQICLQPIFEEIKQKKGVKVLVCLGSHWPNKQLSKETLQSFLQCLLIQLPAHFLFIWGNKVEKGLAEELLAALPQHSSLVDRLSLPALQNLMAQVDLVLAVDSLPLHLAGTTATPTYSIFGASCAQKYRPLGKYHQSFQGSCPYGETFDKRCRLLRTCATGACIKALEGQHIFAHFSKWWSALKEH